MSERLTDEQFRGRVKHIHGDDIWPTEPYRGHKISIGFQCACGHKWSPRPQNILPSTGRKPSGCPECAKRKAALSDSEYKSRVKEIHCGRIWPTEPYKHAKAKIAFRCQCGHVWSVESGSVIYGSQTRGPSGCYHCGNKKISKALSLSDVKYKERLSKRHNNTICLIGTYEGSRTVGAFVCNVCKHEWTANALAVARSDSGGCRGRCRLAECIGSTLEELDEWWGVKKRCRICKLVKIVGEFGKQEGGGKSQRTLDGREHFCKQCRSDALAKRNRERRTTDMQFKIACTLRKRLADALVKKGARKSKRAIEYLGCTIQECILHLEIHFKRGMTWENHGTFWHIDHKIPIAEFDLTKESERQACFHFRNLQPLKCSENLSKSYKVTHPQMSLCI